MGSIRGLPEAILAAVVVAVVGLMLLPLPTALLDLLLAGNLTLSVLLLLTAFFLRDPSSFGSFPTILLVTTLFRLALNVSTTRLILSQADAGAVIQAFGEVVVRGDYVVGAVVFLILTLVQVAVIARGAERVAEVGARFTLDAMPGKQLAIDADLRAGIVDAAGAGQRRRALERESQFYGAMDGAMKFVRGDAIAAVAITGINLVGGLVIGTLFRDLDVGEALRLYGLLTIGDGLVSQLPALLISTAAGLVVTRVASLDEGGSLGQDLAQQLFGDPRALAVAAVFAALLAALPGLPTVPFATLAVALGAGAFLRRRPGSVAEGRGPPPRGTALALVAHPGTAPRLRAFAPARGDTDALFQRLGVRWPVHRVEEDRGLPEDAVRIELAGAPEATVRVTEDLAPLADRLRELLPARPEALFGLQELRNELDRLGPEVPALLRAVIPERVDEAGLAALLRGLLREGVSVRPLREILEALAEGPPLPDGLEGRLVRLREGLSGPLTAPHVRDGRLLVHRVDPEVEEVLREATGPDGRLAAPPELLQELRQSASKALEEGGVLLCRGDVRPLLRDALLGRVPPAPVLAYGEVDARVEVTVGAPMRPGGV